jgi:hypothetical protein
MPFNPAARKIDDLDDCGSLPRIENDCRDVLASTLADKLERYGGFQVLTEAASSGGTRADLLMTCGESAVPI